MMKKLLLLAFAIVAFAACSEDKEPLGPSPVPDKVTGIALDRKTVELTPEQTLQLVATVAPEGVEAIVSWTSDNTKVAMVSDAGLVTAVATGTARVTVSCGDFSDECVVTVAASDPVLGVTLDRETAELTPEQTLQLVATVTPDGVEAVVSWTSDNTKVATVSDAGLVTAVAPGTAKVTASCGNFSDECVVTVAALPDPTETISFETAENMAGIDGEAVALHTITLVSGKNSAEYQNLYWAKEYTEANDMRDDYDQLYFAAPLFSTSTGDIWFSSYYCDCTIYGAQYDAWGGFVLSSNVNKSVSPTQAGVENQFEAYADGGANGSMNFAVCYDAKTAGMAMSADCCWPQIDFTDGARSVRSVCLANSTWTYNYFKGNVSDKYGVKITGYKNDMETSNVVCLLINGAEKVDGWKTFDISSLGEVDRLTLLVVSSEKYAPLYFCMDDLVLNK